MLNKINDFIQSLDVENAKLYSRTYFNVLFTDDELNKVLPYLKSSWKDYLEPTKKQLFIDRLIVASSQNTANKVLFIVNKLLKLYNFTYF